VKIGPRVRQLEVVAVEHDVDVATRYQSGVLWLLFLSSHRNATLVPVAAACCSSSGPGLARLW
jgi:hypothetical protein